MSKQDLSSHTGILLICHGDLGKQFIAAAKIIYKQPIAHVSALSIKANYDRETVLEKTVNELKNLASECKQIIVMCDAYGATAARLVNLVGLEGIEIQCVYGVNLPMVLDCITIRDGNMELNQLAERICQSGKDAIACDSPHQKDVG